VRALCEMPFDSDNSGDNRPHYLTLSPEALDDLHWLMTKIEPELGIGRRLDCMQDWGGKLAGAVVRIAGILHSVEHTNRPWDTLISQQSMAAAIAIGLYLVPHARAAFELMGADAELEGAKTILRWIKQKHLTEFSARDVHRAMQRRIKKAEDVATCLKKLEAHNVIRDKVKATVSGKKSPGRPPSPMFEVNPAVHGTDILKSADTNDKNHPRRPNRRNSVNSVNSVSASGEPDSSPAHIGGNTSRVVARRSSSHRLVSGPLQRVAYGTLRVITGCPSREPGGILRRTLPRRSSRFNRSTGTNRSVTGRSAASEGVVRSD